MEDPDLDEAKGRNKERPEESLLSRQLFPLSRPSRGGRGESRQQRKGLVSGAMRPKTRLWSTRSLIAIRGGGGRLRLGGSRELREGNR